MSPSIIIIIIIYLFQWIDMIKAQIRAAETITQIKEELLKQRRERERDTTRAVLRKVIFVI